jgi:hypothetical protein
MSKLPPSLQEWKSLYEAAIEFKKIKCWDWMLDSDMFGVKNSETGEIGYCCVMGRLGEHFALAVYLGTEGLKGYFKMQSGEIPGGIELLMTQKCLMASFEDRAVLQKSDLEVIKKLGLKFRGRNEWPLFRSYLPGYHPWYLTEEEARFLTFALQQAVEVALRFKGDPEMLIPPERGYFFVRVAEKEGERWRWKDAWLEPSPIEIEGEEIVAEPVDENRLERIKGRARRQQRILEIDFFYSSQGVREEKERPYYPYVLLLADHYSGLILCAHIAKPLKSEYQREFVEKILNFFEENEVIPEKILVEKEGLYKLFEPVTSRLGIKLKETRRLRAIEDAKDSLYECFARR